MDSQASIDLYAPNVQEDWFPTYRRLRNEFPVYRIPGTSLFVITRYADVLHVLRHQDIFPTGGSATRHRAAQEIYNTKGWPRSTPLSTNPPEHRKFRELVDSFFDAEGSAQWRELIQQTIDDLLNEIIAQSENQSRTSPTADFVAEFALPLPIRVITQIMGFPVHDIPLLKKWSSAWVLPFSGPLDDEQEVWVAENVVEFQHYINDTIEMKRHAPGPDVISHLVQARFDGERLLTNHEIISIVDHLFIGGNETTTFAITSALWILLREPGLYERIRDDRSLIAQFIEECLRLESPTQGLYRTVATDTTVGGVDIPAGAVVHIRYGSANRDERIFPNPDVVDLDRTNTRRHMAFSLGEHHCPGSSLSRLEQNMALNAILDRLPNLHFTPEANNFSHHPGFVLRALQELHISWT
jgi:cytochrome P450